MTVNDRHLMIFVSVVLFTLLINIVAVTLATGHAERVRAHQWLYGAADVRVAEPDAQARAPAPPAQRTAAPSPAPAPQTGSGVVAVRHEGPLPLDDPDDPAWNNASAATVTLMPQAMAMPTTDTASVSQVELRAMTDGQAIAFRVTWQDDTLDDVTDVGRFSDAVALQFPLTSEAPMTMGAQGMRVNIWYWKAVWQKDVDEGFQDVQDLYPNYWTDLYWFADRPDPALGVDAQPRVPDDFGDPASRQFFPAHAAGNPMADFERAQPVQELIAEGFGSLTHNPSHETVARGAWNDGRWAVVFARPLRTDGIDDYQFSTAGSVSIAVWDGSSGDVGARKNWSLWVPLEVQP